VAHSRKLIAPIVSAAIATIGLTSFAIVVLVRREGVSPLQLFSNIWPLVVTSAVAVTLVMSVLYRALLEVVQELQAREAAAQHAALHDPLTGLPNRALLEDRLDHAITRCKREGEKIALLMLDLDRFKSVNDTYGHAVGDELVRQVGVRLKELLREADTVARIGGDEFTILQSGPVDSEDVKRLCDRIIAALHAPFEIAGHQVEVGASIGAALVSSAAETSAEILRKADHLMYRAKSGGRGCYRIWSDKQGASGLARAA
jgi:diguanylate cyclase (GGDEF)-like protein